MEFSVKTLLSFMTEVMLAAILTVSAVASTYGSEETIKGDITPGGEFSSSKGEIYHLSGNKATELSGHSGANVEITGYVMEKEGRKLLNVKSYTFQNRVKNLPAK